MDMDVRVVLVLLFGKVLMIFKPKGQCLHPNGIARRTAIFSHLSYLIGAIEKCGGYARSAVIHGLLGLQTEVPELVVRLVQEKR